MIEIKSTVCSTGWNILSVLVAIGGRLGEETLRRIVAAAMCGEFVVRTNSSSSSICGSSQVSTETREGGFALVFEKISKNGGKVSVSRGGELFDEYWELHSQIFEMFFLFEDCEWTLRGVSTAIEKVEVFLRDGTEIVREEKTDLEWLGGEHSRVLSAAGEGNSPVKIAHYL